MQATDIAAAVKFVREKQSAMDEEILIAIGKAAEKFRAATGLSPSAVDVTFVNAGRIEDRGPHYMVGEVQTSVSLDF
jgi:hypothetical protein